MSLFIHLTFAQQQKADSFINVLNSSELTLDERFDDYNRMCIVYKDVNSDSLSKYAQEGISFAKKEKNEAMLTVFYRYAGISCFQKQDYNTASFYLDNALKLSIKRKDKNDEACVYLAIGYMYGSQSEFKLMIENMLKALLMFEALDEKEKQMETLVSIGSAYRRVGNADMAIKYLNKAKDMAKESNNAFLNALLYFELGATVSDDKSVIEYQLKAIEFARLANNKAIENLANQALAATYLSDDLKDYNNALTYAKECYRIAMEQGDKYYIYSALTMLSNVYNKQKNYKLCDAISVEAWAMDSTNLAEARTLVRNISISNIYLGNKEKAAGFLKKYEELTNRYITESYHKEMVEMEVKYETEKKEMRITSLEKERQLYVWIGIAGVLFALSLGVALWLKIRNSQKERQLVASAAVQEGEMGERERIACELHDRLLGTLSAVKSELNNTDISEKLNGCIEEIRRISRNLMPLPLRFGMKTALEDFTAQFHNVYFHFFGQEKRIEKRLEFVVYWEKK